jgi:signal transduction histidine kinase/ligand-binding sensor domain-containing protein
MVGHVLAACATAALALDVGRQLAQFHHQVFLPQGTNAISIASLAQADDGYLWVGTSVGLYRFDGATFELMHSLGGQSIRNLPVRFLYAEPGGGVWIGYSGGAGAGYYKQGRYVGLSPERGWNSLVSVAVDRDNVVWAVLNRRLMQIEQLVPKEIAGDTGLPDAVAREVIVDKAGTVWASNTGAQDLMYLPRGEKRFRWTGQHMGSELITAASDGTIFVSGRSGLRAVATRDGLATKVVLISSREFGRVLVDRDGGLLAATLGGLVRADSAHRLLEPGGGQQLTTDAPLPLDGPESSSAIVWTMLEDRDGNLWVASNAALERFRDSRFAPVRIPGSSFPFGVAAGRDGVVWAANWDSGLLKIEDRARITPIGNLGPHISCVYRDAAGTIWAAAPSGLWRSDEAQAFARVSIPDSLLQPWVSTMTLDGSGSLWFAAGSLVRGSPANGKWSEISSGEGLSEQFLARAMMADSSRRVWLAGGYEVALVEEGRSRALTAVSNALHVGAIQTLSERDDRVWVGGLQGLAVVRGESVLNLTVKEGPSFRQVTGIIESPDGELWVRGVDDAWRVVADELRSALRAGQGEVQIAAEHFDALDGLDSIALNQKPNLARASDGLLWFGTNQGLAWIDPRRPPPVIHAPIRHIASVTVDGQAQPVAATLTLPPLTHRVEIGYTAIELGYPERIRFRYKLEGFDRDWEIAGARRVAYYDNLPPGDYRFRVSSTDRAGRWQDEGDATLSIHHTAAWFQSAWFRLACVLAALFMATVAYRLRMRHVAGRLRSELQRRLEEQDRIATARQAERDRIARELHDTLLQGVYGLIWKIQAVAERVPRGDPLRVSMDAALDGADRLLVEGRDRVSDLRAGTHDPVDLIGQVQQVVDEIDSTSSVAFVPTSRGTNVALLPRVHAEVLLLATEALRNAFRHAGATRIELNLDYGPEAFGLAVSDDGVGMLPKVMDKGVTGHWGLAGMKERARSIGATLTVTAREGGGTVVELRVPASLAYGPVP